MQAAGPPQGIVWITSYPKSGNTWVRSFLHNLLQVIGGDPNEAHDINAMNRYSTWDIASKEYEALLGKSPRTAARAEIAAVRAAVQEKIADIADGLSFVKTHNALVMDRGHPTINARVTSGAVYLVRNPLDVAISFAHHMGVGIDAAIERMGTRGLETEVTEHTVYEVYGSWSEHVESWTAKPNRAVFVMRYEDMVAAPETAFGNLARHLLLLPTEAQLREAIARSSFKELQDQEERAGFREKPEPAQRFFRKGQVGEWRNTLRRLQVRRIVRAHGEQMQRFGYLPDGSGTAARQGDGD